MKEKHNRILGVIAGAFVGALTYTIAHLFIAGVTISGVASIIMLFLPGLVGGVILGAVFPKPFTWLAGLILDSWP